MNRNILVSVVILILAILGVIFYIGKSKTSQPEKSSPKSTTQISSSSFQNPKKAAHYESNTPEHGSTLAGVPINVVVNFNFDLAQGSSISITKDEKQYGVGEIKIDENKLAMRLNMDSQAPDGFYTVNYRACWADGSCHDGSFQFAIDSARSSEFEDLRSQKEVTINLKNITFNPKNVRVSRGTKVIWVNQDNVEHTVNTDQHPNHTYYLQQNSRTLKVNDTYAVIFNDPGIYPYHCTPHAGIMTGAILVD